MLFPTKTVSWLVAAFALLSLPAHAQTARDLTEIGLDLYQQANSPHALERMHQELVNAPEAYLVSIDQPGALVLLSGRSMRVPGMKYNVALHLLEVRDSTGSHVWPPGSLDGFYLGRGSDARHFRSLQVRDGGTKTDFVEILNANDHSPLLLGVQHVYVHEDAELEPILHTVTKKARTEIGTQVLSGPGGASKEPLRPLQLNQRAVLRLFGNRAAEMEAYATAQQLSYTDLGHVLRMVEYFNKKSAQR